MALVIPEKMACCSDRRGLHQTIRALLPVQSVIDWSYNSINPTKSMKCKPP